MKVLLMLAVAVTLVQTKPKYGASHYPEAPTVQTLPPPSAESGAADTGSAEMSGTGTGTTGSGTSAPASGSATPDKDTTRVRTYMDNWSHSASDDSPHIPVPAVPNEWSPRKSRTTPSYVNSYFGRRPSSPKSDSLVNRDTARSVVMPRMKFVRRPSMWAVSTPTGPSVIPTSTAETYASPTATSSTTWAVSTPTGPSVIPTSTAETYANPTATSSTTWVVSTPTEPSVIPTSTAEAYASPTATGSTTWAVSTPTGPSAIPTSTTETYACPTATGFETSAVGTSPGKLEAGINMKGVNVEVEVRKAKVFIDAVNGTANITDIMHFL